MPALSKFTAPFKYIKGDERLTAIPCARPQLGKLTFAMRRLFWIAEEVDLTTDAVDYKAKLNPPTRHALETIIAFFSAGDGIINVNLAERFSREVKMQDATYFYNFQAAMEDIHALMYGRLIEVIIPDRERREHLINAIETIPVVKKISAYMHRVIASDAPFAERLLAMACIEGVLFQGCFCFIYWLQQQGLMPGLGQSNELIARDEALHAVGAAVLYRMMESWAYLTNARAAEIIAEVVALSDELNRYALPVGLAGMNAGMMLDHVKSCADNIFDMITYDVDHVGKKWLPYGVKSAFTFMDQINMANRSSFFERKVTEYAKAEGANDEDEIIEDY